MYRPVSQVSVRMSCLDLNPIRKQCTARVQYISLISVVLFAMFYLIPFQYKVNVSISAYEGLRIQSTGMTCHLPKLNPFDPSIQKFLGNHEPYNCSKIIPLLFYTDLDSNLILNATLETFSFIDCCYKDVLRGNGTNDNTYIYSSQCEPIKSNITRIPSTKEFIVVFCVNTTSNKSQVVDMFNFVHLKLDVEDRIIQNTNSLESDNDTEKSGEGLNVVIFGLDAVSHLNFVRTMEKTHSYIKNNLSALSMDGYTKIGENTLPNLTAGLGGMSYDEANASCFGATKYFDTCPLIWKNYSANGYRTLFGEDAPNMAIFNYMKRGFQKPPTDYYTRPMMRAIKNNLGNHKSMNVHLCYGPRLAFNILLDFVKKAAYTFGNTKKYFQFIWSSTLTHDKQNNPKMGDEALLGTIEWLHSQGYLNKTVLVLMSDHGLRYGGLRNTYQGSIEGRMPYLYFIFPKWFSDKYSEAVQNMRKNSERLTTSFDLHETLLDLINLNAITEKNIIEREKSLELDLKNNTLPNRKRAISLFLPIPLERNCDTAQIPPHYCVCNEMKPVSVNAEIQSVGDESVKFINDDILLSYPQCSPLKLKQVTSARKSVAVNEEIQKKAENDVANSTVTYIITLTTSPGDADFEVSASRSTKQSDWTISKEISRINLYGNQSHCVDESNLKKFCFCL